MSELRKRKDSDVKAPESAESDHVSSLNSVLLTFSLIHLTCLHF